jgi:hypothetical protein
MQISKKTSISNSCKSRNKRNNPTTPTKDFSSNSKRKLGQSQKALKKGREITVILISDIDLLTLRNRNRHGDISHCGKSHDGYMSILFGKSIYQLLFLGTKLGSAHCYIHFHLLVHFHEFSSVFNICQQIINRSRQVCSLF